MKYLLVFLLAYNTLMTLTTIDYTIKYYTSIEYRLSKLKIDLDTLQKEMIVYRESHNE